MKNFRLSCSLSFLTIGSDNILIPSVNRRLGEVLHTTSSVDHRQLYKKQLGFTYEQRRVYFSIDRWTAN